MVIKTNFGVFIEKKQAFNVQYRPPFLLLSTYCIFYTVLVWLPEQYEQNIKFSQSS